MLSWYALQSKPRSEKLVSLHLAAREIESYLPVWRRRGPASTSTPFFPGYLFAYADLETVGLWALQYMPGVKRLVFSGDEPARLDQSLIDDIKQRLGTLELDAGDALGETLAAGDRVVIVDGPLAGWEAIYDSRLSSGERVRLLVDFISRRTPVVIDRAQVQKGSTSWTKTRSLPPLCLTRARA